MSTCANYITTTHLKQGPICFIAFLSLYIVLTDALICSAAQLQKCLINLLTYLLTYKISLGLLNFITALHGMQTCSSDENSVRLSVCPSNA